MKVEAVITTTVEVKVTPWQRIDGKWEHAPYLAAVRIWVMFDPVFRRWWQCHEWEMMGSNRERRADGWIPSIGKRNGGFDPHYVDPDPGDDHPPFDLRG